MKTNKNRGNNALLIMLVTSPIWIIPLALLVNYLDERYSAPKVEKVYNYPRYEYPDDTILAHPEIKMFTITMVGLRNYTNLSYLH